MSAERKILEFLAEKHLARREDIIKMLDGEADAKTTVNAACESLIAQGYLSPVSPIGPTCYAITQKGLRALRE